MYFSEHFDQLVFLQLPEDDVEFYLCEDCPVALNHVGVNFTTHNHCAQAHEYLDSSYAAGSLKRVPVPAECVLLLEGTKESDNSLEH